MLVIVTVTVTANKYKQKNKVRSPKRTVMDTDMGSGAGTLAQEQKDKPHMTKHMLQALYGLYCLSSSPALTVFTGFFDLDRNSNQG